MHMAFAARRAVFDTGIFLQAALNPDGPAASAVRRMEAGEVDVFLCPRLRAEIEDVLERPALRAKYPRLTDELTAEILQRIDAITTMVPNPPRHWELPRDPKDEPPLNLAIEVRADYLTSRDRDLLALNDEADFLARYPALRITDPVTLLNELDLLISAAAAVNTPDETSSP
jgi:putative PIN family toxin of toxin-antitoxin system